MDPTIDNGCNDKVGCFRLGLDRSVDVGDGS